MLTPSDRQGRAAAKAAMPKALIICATQFCIRRLTRSLMSQRDGGGGDPTPPPRQQARALARTTERGGNLMS